MWIFMKGYVMGKSIKVMTEEASMRRVESGKSMSPSACVMKRCFDMAGSLLGILVLSPVFVVIYLLIKWEDGGTAIFKQERVGHHGKLFTLYKFRSMSMQAEADGKPVLCQKGDKRLTRIGKFLREHHWMSCHNCGMCLKER